MRWEKLRRSQNVDDRRGRGRPRGGRRTVVTGGGCLTIILALVAYFVLGIDPRVILGGSTQVTQPAPQQQQQQSEVSDELHDFASAIKGSCEEEWTQIFAQYGQRYTPSRLVAYSGATRMRTGGVADSRLGPFYLPAEQTIYLDTDFFYKMKQEYRAAGDFAYAYVIAHEGAHHVQHLLGYTNEVFSKRGRVPEKEYNRLSVRLELQADFLAGVWAHHANKRQKQKTGLPLLEEGDVQEAMRAAQAIGDDALQRQAQGFVVADSFTHGSSEQRLRWFMKGFKTGDIKLGDTFSIPYSQL